MGEAVVTGAYLLRAREANLELGILAGDHLVAEKADSAEPGQIVVALVDEAATVRRFEPGVQVMGRVLEVFGKRG